MLSRRETAQTHRKTSSDAGAEIRTRSTIPVPGDNRPGPEWYFLFLFQHLRLKMFSGEFGQFLGAIAFPSLLGALLVALPFIDRDPERNIFKRPIALTLWVMFMVSILIFTVSAIINREFLD